MHATNEVAGAFSMDLYSGERQVAPTRAGIRRDHVARYEWAAKMVPVTARGSHIADVACGIGYGTQLLAEAGHWAWGIDNAPAAIAYADQHYAHERASYRVADASSENLFSKYSDWDAAVCFETIEHLADPVPLLRTLGKAQLLLASVPNEEVFPWKNYAFHHRHYTRAQFEQLLNAAGWHVTEWWGQEGPESEVERDINGRTLIAVAVRKEAVKVVDDMLRVRASAKETEALAPTSVKPSAHAQATMLSGLAPAVTKPAAPNHVAILALGPSLELYSKLTKPLGARHKFCDEVWAVNAVGDVYACDRVFHMDDVRIQEIRAAAQPDSNIAAMLEWLKRHPGPIYTSRAHPDYPGLVEFPLQDVINDIGFAYFNSTAAAAVAYAIYLGVKKMSLFGFDFTYANSHHAEKGRANVEFLLGIATARGIKLSVPRQSSLMDACTSQAERLYGYDTLDVAIKPQAEGCVTVSFTPRATLPTAEEIEDRYDHTRHPSPLPVDP